MGDHRAGSVPLPRRTGYSLKLELAQLKEQGQDPEQQRHIEAELHYRREKRAGLLVHDSVV